MNALKKRWLFCAVVISACLLLGEFLLQVNWRRGVTPAFVTLPSKTFTLGRLLHPQRVTSFPRCVYAKLMNNPQLEINHLNRVLREKAHLSLIYQQTPHALLILAGGGAATPSVSAGLVQTLRTRIPENHPLQDALTKLEIND